MFSRRSLSALLSMITSHRLRACPLLQSSIALNDRNVLINASFFGCVKGGSDIVVASR